ncbi:MAG: GDCCVxC domain-containing (seleno)protein [Herbaspirillum sp.]
MTTAVFESVLTCPECGYAKVETMPTTVYRFFYQCENCKALLRPKAGDCCVYCSYGSVKCPSVQEQHRYCT